MIKEFVKKTIGKNFKLFKNFPVNLIMRLSNLYSLRRSLMGKRDGNLEILLANFEGTILKS